MNAATPPAPNPCSPFIPASVDMPDHSSMPGFYGPYGGQFVAPALTVRLEEIAAAFERYQSDPTFVAELNDLYAHFSGRPTPIFYCANLSEKLGGAKIFLKREDLNHLGAHKLNNTLGQMLIAKRMGKTRVVAETGAGQHGVATAATAALLGLECTVHMGEENMRRQELNVLRMRMMGATVTPVTRGQSGLKDAIDASLQALMLDPELFYVVGSAVGPHPYPGIVRYFQSVIGRESRRQMREITGRLPDVALACVGGGSNAIGLFACFTCDLEVELIGVEPGGRGLGYGDHAATLTRGTPGIMHGFRSYLLQDEKGDSAPVYSVSAGLDYPGVGPEHSYLKDTGRASYVTVSDTEALDAFFALSRTEGILPALEAAHALAHAMRIAPGLGRDKNVLVCLSGSGDKDVDQIARMMKDGVIAQR